MKSHRHPSAAVTTVRILAKTLPPGRAEKCHSNYCHCFSCFGVVSPAPIFKNCLCFLFFRTRQLIVVTLCCHSVIWSPLLNALHPPAVPLVAIAPWPASAIRRDWVMCAWCRWELWATGSAATALHRSQGESESWQAVLPQPLHWTGSRAALGSQLCGKDAVSLNRIELKQLPFAAQCRRTNYYVFGIHSYVHYVPPVSQTVC